MALDVITWLWGNKYSPVDVAKLASQVRKNLRIEHRFHVFVNGPYINAKFPDFVLVSRIKDTSLIGKPCFCRLRMFDPKWQKENKFEHMIVSLDLDLVITGPLDRIFGDDEDFKILQGVNAVNPNPFNASIMQLKVGCHPEIWSEFSLDKADKIPYHEFPDDQGWIWHMLPNAKGWKPGPEHGVYVFKKPGWPGGSTLPADANIVGFIGYRKPEMFRHLPWVQRYWSDAA